VIFLKSPKELERLREAGRVTALALQRVIEAVRPGVSTAELDRVAEKTIRSEGCVPSFLGYRGYPASLCTSIGSEIVHGIPSERRVLREGDLVSLDIGAVHEGYHGDSAVTMFVGDAAPPDGERRLVEATRTALAAGIGAVRRGGRLSDIGHAIEQVGEAQGLGIVREYGGHGVGRALHEDPFVPNVGRPGRGPELRAGLVLAIEPMFTLGTWETRVLEDRWTVVTADGSLAAHFEHTVAITADGVEVLTAPPEGGVGFEAVLYGSAR
jgi:methionyl aminopeptidase